MPSLREQFGRQVTELRKSRQITQEQLADAIDLSVESVSNIERGIYAPRFDTLERIANTLGVPVKQLFDFE